MDPITVTMWMAVVTQAVASLAQIMTIGNRLAAGEVVTIDELNAAKAMNDADVSALDAAVAALPEDKPE